MSTNHSRPRIAAVHEFWPSPVSLRQLDAMASSGCSVSSLMGSKRLPKIARARVVALGAQLLLLKAQILQFDRMITARRRFSEASRRRDDIPDFGARSRPRSDGEMHREGIAADRIGRRRHRLAVRVFHDDAVRRPRQVRVGIVDADRAERSRAEIRKIGKAGLRR